MKFICILFFFAVTTGALPAAGKPDKDEKETRSREAEAPVSVRDADLLTVSGRVRLVGTAMFSHLVVTDAEDNDWYVEEEDRQKLSRMEQRPVTVRGSPEYRDIIMANGKKAGVQRFLRNITLLE